MQRQREMWKMQVERHREASREAQGMTRLGTDMVGYSDTQMPTDSTAHTHRDTKTEVLKNLRATHAQHFTRLALAQSRRGGTAQVPAGWPHTTCPSGLGHPACPI